MTHTTSTTAIIKTTTTTTKTTAKTTTTTKTIGTLPSSITYHTKETENMRQLNKTTTKSNYQKSIIKTTTTTMKTTAKATTTTKTIGTLASSITYDTKETENMRHLNKTTTKIPCLKTSLSRFPMRLTTQHHLCFLTQNLICLSPIKIIIHPLWSLISTQHLPI